MKLLVRKLWFPDRYSVDKTVGALLGIPQMKKLFDEGFAYEGEMRPQGIKIYPGCWPADAILDRLPDPESDVYLVLTSRDLMGKFKKIKGKGRKRKVIASNNAFLSGIEHRVFDTNDVGFNAMVIGEIGHALGLIHHEFDPSKPCEMSHNFYPGPNWSSLQDIHLCDYCYQKISNT